MAPGKRGRKCKPLMIDSSTQTQVSPSTRLVNELLQPAVVLEKIDLPQYSNAIGNNEFDNSKSESGVHSSSDKNKKLSSNVSNVPTNYSIFARPITNKRSANSTLLNLQNRNTDQAVTSSKSRTYLQPKPQKKVKFIKPGPLCYKKKLLENENLVIPVMLGEVQNCSPQNNLETIFERNEENTPNELAPDCNEQMLINEKGTQTIIENDNLLIDESTEHDVVLNVTPIGTSSPFNPMPEDIRLQFGGVTTIISTRSADRRSDSCEDDHSSETYEDNNKEDDKTAKYIKINASTVHIHNHFYKT